MPAIQPIPRNAPSSADVEAGQILATHNRATLARTRKPEAWNPPTRRATVTGENAGRRVK